MNRRDRRAEKSKQRKAEYQSDAFKALVRTAESLKLGKEKSGDAVAASPCGHCGKLLDGATSADGDKASDGDISICIYCFEVNTFGPGMKLLPMTDADVEAHSSASQIREHQAFLRAAVTKAAIGKRSKPPEA